MIHTHDIYISMHVLRADESYLYILCMSYVLILRILCSFMSSWYHIIFVYANWSNLFVGITSLVSFVFYKLLIWWVRYKLSILVDNNSFHEYSWTNDNSFHYIHTCYHVWLNLIALIISIIFSIHDVNKNKSKKPHYPFRL